jgi:hypothetical protein
LFALQQHDAKKVRHPTPTLKLATWLLLSASQKLLTQQKHDNKHRRNWLVGWLVGW